MTSPYDCAKHVQRVLEEDPNTAWTLDRLASRVVTASGYTNVNRIKMVIKAMCGSGSINFRRPYGRERYTNLQFKPSGDPKAMEQQAERFATIIDALKEKVEEAKQEVADAKAARVQDKIVAVHTYKKPNSKPVVTEELFHGKFERLCQLVNARQSTFLYGPTGCGKSFICSQVAKVCGLKFYFISCTAGMSEGQITGRLLPTGEAGRFEYVMSEFVKAYEKGGLFLLDEMDAADPNVLLIINAALANGQMALANRPEKPYAKRHKDFVCVAAANTVGTGADRMYSGRNKLDGATLDRFLVGKVFLDYDKNVEESVCPNDEIRNHFWAVREAINENLLERSMSTRFLIDAYKMHTACEWGVEELNQAFFEGWREDEVNKVKSSLAARGFELKGI